MSFDPKHMSTEAPLADYASMVFGMRPQCLYDKLDSQHENTDAAVCAQDGSALISHYNTVPTFDHFSAEYSNTPMYVTKSSISGMSQFKPTSATENPPTQTLSYIQPSQYDEIPEYDLTGISSEMIGPQYIEDSAVTYGYVDESNYGCSTSVNNAFSLRPLVFDDNLNGSETASGLDVSSRSFKDHISLHNKVSQMNLGNLESSSHLRDCKEEALVASNTDICSTLRWRDPNLSEVISFLNSPNNAIKANAAAYLQHLCYMDDPNKQRTRTLGGIPPLIRLLAYDIPEIHKNACGALRNLSYGRQNDENKRAIRNAGGITSLVNLLNRVQDVEVKELVTGVLWNMSSCEDIKRAIIDESLSAIVINIIKPHSGWDPLCPGDTCYSTVFRNASGVLRNVSSAGEYARTCLRTAENLVECLLYVIKTAIMKNNIGNKTVENCVCILRNLSYRCQEVEDPNYDKQPLIVTNKATASTYKGENLGCFGTNKKKKDVSSNEHLVENALSYNSAKSSNSQNKFLKGYEQLWHPDVVQYYLTLLQSCSNPETLEAAAGAIQNLSACFWQPSIDIRAAVRKEKGLPILVELLRMEVDRVVCAVATALRNLAIDQRNKELIGKYAMRDLVQKLPSGNPQQDQSTSDDTISAVLATVNEVIKKNPEFSRSLLDAGGIERLMTITKQRQKYSSCVLKFSSQVLFTMWQHYELRDVFKKNGWKESDFITKYISTSNTSPNSPNNANNTLSRPMASQGRTRYEDRTIQRIQNNCDDGHAMCNESLILCQMGDEVSANGANNEEFQNAPSSTTAMYIPNTRNHSS